MIQLETPHCESVLADTVSDVSARFLRSPMINWFP